MLVAEVGVSENSPLDGIRSAIFLTINTTLLSVLHRRKPGDSGPVTPLQVTELERGAVRGPQTVWADLAAPKIGRRAVPGGEGK